MTSQKENIFMFDVDTALVMDLLRKKYNLPTHETGEDYEFGRKFFFDNSRAWTIWSFFFL